MWSALECSNVAGISHRCIIPAEKFIGGNEWNHCIASHCNECQGDRCCGLVTECTKRPTSCTPGNFCISFVCQVHQLQWHSSGSQNYISEHLDASLTEIWFLLLWWFLSTNTQGFENELTWSRKKKVQARDIVHGRGMATMTAERRE